MAGLRGSTQLWGVGLTGTLVGTSGTTGASGDVSKNATVGAAGRVCVYISCTGSTGATFNVQAGTIGSNAPGENAMNDVLPDEGLMWFDYDRARGLTAPAGSNKAFDLSLFAPQYMRLKRTDGNTNVSIVAYVTSES